MTGTPYRRRVQTRAIRNRRLSWLLLAAVVIATVAYLFMRTQPVASAELFAQFSNVDLTPADGEPEQLALHDTRPLGVGDAVSVDGEGEAHFKFSDWLLVRMFRDSGLVMDAMSDPDALPLADLRLNAGTVLASLTPDEQADRRVSVRTEFAVITALGTEFFVYYDTESRITWVVVIEGTVQVEGAGEEIDLSAGFQTWVLPGEPPREPIPAVRELIGDRFPLVDDLTNRALSDRDVLVGSAPDSSGGPGVYTGRVGGARIEVDLSETTTGLAAQAEALRQRVEGPEAIFVVAQVSNDGDEPVTFESVEVEDDTGVVVTMEPVTRLVRALRSQVDPYDTETYEIATELLDDVRQQTQTVPAGETAELLLGAETSQPSIAEVVAVGSFGRQRLLLR